MARPDAVAGIGCRILQMPSAGDGSDGDSGCGPYSFAGRRADLESILGSFEWREARPA